MPADFGRAMGGWATECRWVSTAASRHATSPIRSSMTRPMKPKLFPLTALSSAFLLASTLAAGAAHAETLQLTIDPSHTAPYYEIGHLGFSIERGTFKKVSGRITLDTAARSGSVDIRIDAASLDANWPERDAVLKGPDFFDVARFPAMSFKSSALRFDDTGALTAVSGEFTLRGITKPLTLRVSQFKCGPHPLLKKTWCGVEADATIKRSDFGMTAFIPALPDEVHLVIPVEAGT